MPTNLLKDFSLKWWSSLEAQQKLTVGMAAIIVALCWVVVRQEKSKEELTVICNERKREIREDMGKEVLREKAAKDACQEAQILYLQNDLVKYQKLFFETKKLESQINENKKK